MIYGWIEKHSRFDIFTCHSIDGAGSQKKQNRMSIIRLSKVLININIDAKYVGTLRWHLPVFTVLHFKIVFFNSNTISSSPKTQLPNTLWC